MSVGLCVVTTIGCPNFARGQEAQDTVRLPPVVVEAAPEPPERLYSEEKA
jgi:hypothetical protein